MFGWIFGNNTLNPTILRKVMSFTHGFTTRNLERRSGHVALNMNYVATFAGTEARESVYDEVRTKRSTFHQINKYI